MIVPQTGCSFRGRALIARKVERYRYGRQNTVTVNALFGMGAPASSNNEAVLELVNSKLGGPSEAGNEKVAEAVRTL